MITEINGDLLNSTEEYILQQSFTRIFSKIPKYCNCYLSSLSPHAEKLNTFST
jgi:hypothetical protein